MLLLYICNWGSRDLEQLNKVLKITQLEWFEKGESDPRALSVGPYGLLEEKAC